MLLKKIEAFDCFPSLFQVLQLGGVALPELVGAGGAARGRIDVHKVGNRVLEAERSEEKRVEERYSDSRRESSITFALHERTM